MMALYFIALMIIPAISFFRRHFKTPHVEKVESGIMADDGKTLAENFWKRKDISLKDIALSVARLSSLEWFLLKALHSWIA
ncbi:hypothetical protein MEZE111188_11575 [Mesobacillus zeae]